MGSLLNDLKKKAKPWVKLKVLGWRMGMSLPQACLHAAQARTRRDGPRPVHILVVGDGLAYTSDQQFAPITRYIDALRREFGHVFRFRLLDDVMQDRAEDFSGYDAVFLKIAFTTQASRAAAIAARFHKRAAARATPLIYFDGDDDQCVQWRAAIEAADVYIKKHAFADRTDYERDYIGRSNLTDHAVRTFGFDFSGDHVPEAPALPAGEVAKIRVGWNIGLDDKIAKLAAQISSQAAPAERDIDVMCRASGSKDGTLLYAVRHPAAKAIQNLAGQFKVLAPTQQVSQAEYYREMLRSKMCVAPFGFGELCWRDFEAALCGCLMLKPNMDHVETWPNLFVAHQTYVPLLWDYSDLPEKVAYYLARPQELDRIAQAAQRVLHEALTEKGFLARYREVVVPALSSVELKRSVLSRPSGPGMHPQANVD